MSIVNVHKMGLGSYELNSFNISVLLNYRTGDFHQSNIWTRYHYF